ncbi:hypothetical protein GYA19_00325 [Candidatus Beckwithbacteria bacterium]|nr:hypothetical protein [Candidatus Beckwithbacteria bacterium]
MFQNRTEAGKFLAQKLRKELEDIDLSQVIVLSIPNGGVMIGKVISQDFHCLHSLILVKKLRSPYEKELAFGSIGLNKNCLYLDQQIYEQLKISESFLKKEIASRQKILQQKADFYQLKSINLQNKIILLVDDGAATGATMITAIREVKMQKPQKIIVALPVLPFDLVNLLKKEVEKLIYLENPIAFNGVGQFYYQFEQITDKQVKTIINSE